MTRFKYFVVFMFVFSPASMEISSQVWQQYYPQNHVWASITEQIKNRPQRTRMGQGRYRMLPSGNVEISCDFPETMLIVSNIIWERADMGMYDLNQLYRKHGITHQYDVHQRPHGSTLHLFDVTPLDRGLYRCIATTMRPMTNEIETLFQDTEFYPE